jgi:hypothetical protein
VEKNLWVYSPNKVISSPQAHQDIESVGLKNWTLYEIVAFADKHYDVWKSMLIIALGLQSKGRVPVLDGFATIRDLSLNDWREGWPQLYRFGALANI